MSLLSTSSVKSRALCLLVISITAMASVFFASNKIVANPVEVVVKPAVAERTGSDVFDNLPEPWRGRYNQSSAAWFKNVSTIAVDDPTASLIVPSAELQWPTLSILANKSVKNPRNFDYEVARTLYWFRVILSPLVVPSELRDHLILLSNAWRGDDWVLSRWTCADLDLQIADGRSFTILVKPVEQSVTAWGRSTRVRGNLPTEQSHDATAPAPGSSGDKALEHAVLSVYQTLFNFKLYDGGNLRPTVSMTGHEHSGRAQWGRIVLDRGPGWLLRPVYWWSNGDVVVFNIEKLLVPPRAKFGSMRGDLFSGGLAPEDKRAFVRFDPLKTTDFNQEWIGHQSEIKTWYDRFYGPSGTTTLASVQNPRQAPMPMTESQKREMALNYQNWKAQERDILKKLKQHDDDPETPGARAPS